MKNQFSFKMFAGLVGLLGGLWIFFEINHFLGASIMFAGGFITVFNWILWMISWLQPEVEIPKLSWKGVIKGSKPRV